MSPVIGPGRARRGARGVGGPRTAAGASVAPVAAEPGPGGRGPGGGEMGSKAPGAPRRRAALAVARAPGRRGAAGSSRCVAPSSANGARQSGHRDAAVDPAGRRVRARAREAQRARHRPGRARGCDGRRQAEGTPRSRKQVGRRPASAREDRATTARAGATLEMTVRPVVARRPRRGRAPTSRSSRAALVADPPAAAVAQDAEPTAVDVPTAGVVLCRSKHRRHSPARRPPRRRGFRRRTLDRPARASWPARRSPRRRISPRTLVPRHGHTSPESNCGVEFR